MLKSDAVLGMEVVVPKYGVGRVTDLDCHGIGVTPHVPPRGYGGKRHTPPYEMEFDPENVTPWIPAAGLGVRR